MGPLSAEWSLIVLDEKVALLVVDPFIFETSGNEHVLHDF